MSVIHRNNNRLHIAVGAMLAFTIFTAGAPSALGQSAEPLKTIIPVHIDVSTGNITVGSKTYNGVNSGMHLLALKRQPNRQSLDTPTLVQDGTFTNANSANQFLQNVLSATPDAFLLVNAVGNYGFALNAVATSLEKFGSQTDIEAIGGAIPFVLIGNGGRNKGQASQKGYSTLNVDGYLTQDTNGNYTFIQTDYVRYDIGVDGTIKIGATTYPVANANKYAGCDAAASNSFHLVVVSRESPDHLLINNAYCTSQTPSLFTNMVGDIGYLNNTFGEGALYFIASNGKPIPADWNFGTNGDGRIYPLALEVANLGGYWETMVYLTPSDTYSLVGASPPPTGTPGARKRARESSSVYPDSPTGELHGMLARDKRGIWYSPLNADPAGLANLDLYDILAQTAIPFPNPATSDELTAFQYIAQKLCHSPTCNVRNQYANTNISMDIYFSQLEDMRTPDNKDCNDSSNANLPFCIVRQQLLNEFQYVSDIRGFHDNLKSLWLASGTTSILSMLSAYNDIQATLQAPAAAPAPNVVNPIVGFFLGLASFIPEVGPLFGLADTAFNLATSLTTDTSGNPTISLTSTVGQLQQQAIQQFQSQSTTTATQFDLIYQDWGKMQALGNELAQAQPGGDWYWDDESTGQILQAMAPAISASYYRSLMPAVYAVGRYLPQCNVADYCQWGWGNTPLYRQPLTYFVGTNSNTGCCQPFNIDETGTLRAAYMPYTFPTDSANIYENPSQPAYTQGHNTIMAANSWLGISRQSTSQWANGAGWYDPPQESVLSNLFKPRSQGGLGVYRPEFYEAWPFPQVQCYESSIDGPDQGCPWSDGAPSPEARPAPVTSVVIRAGQATKIGTIVNVPLRITNNGTVPTKETEIGAVSLRTLGGSGQAVVVGPVLPIKIGDLAPGASFSVVLQLGIPSGVTKLMITEEGTIDSGRPQPLRFSQGQLIYPQTIK
jgi:hypothetical protein